MDGMTTVLFSAEAKDFSFLQTASFEWVPGALYPGLKRQEREADHSPP
jgi:hypothetical protein